MAYRVKGSTPGYDVGPAADYLLSFNSSWPLLKQQSTGTFSGDISHGLSYPPFYLICDDEGRVDQQAGLNSNAGVDSTSLVYGSLSGARRYFIFRLDITSNYIAPIIESGTTKTAENDSYVFKMTKPGKSIDSTDMRDFALHSNTKSPMLHKVVEQAMTIGPDGWNTTISHGLSYIPIVFVFMKPGANTGGYATTRYMLLAPPIGINDATYEVDSSNVYITAFGDVFNGGIPRVSVVVLKDPIAKETINVSFP